MGAVGDCRIVLSSLDDDSVDAVVTDPPYGLSKEPDIAEVLTHWLAGDDYAHTGSGRPPKSPQSLFAGVLRDAVVRNSHDLDPGSDKECVTFHVTLDAALAQMVLAVDLQNGVSVGQPEVHHDGSGGSVEHLLVDEGNPHLGESFRDGKFRLRVGEGVAGGVGSGSVTRKGDSTLLGVAVRLGDDSLAEPEGASDVVTVPRAELRAVLALDVARRTGELRSADSAGQIDPVFLLESSQPVGAGTGAGGLTTVAEPGDVGHVADSADGTVTFDVEVWLPVGWHESQTSAHKGFMGKSWDSFVPGPAVWREVYRVLKPGGHALVFAGSRTQDLMGISLRMAGFEIRDVLQWLYGNGFPKSMSVSKALDKAGKDGADYEGWGTALKPAYEPILLVRKPLTGTVAANVAEHGTGALHIDACRIGDADTRRVKAGGPNDFPHEDDAWEPREVVVGSQSGRWPANVLLGHSEDCEQVGTKRVYTGPGATAVMNRSAAENEGNTSAAYNKESRPAGQKQIKYRNEDGTEDLPDWRCVEDCPARLLDEQSGVSKSTDRPRNNTAEAHNGTNSMGKSSGDWTTGRHRDSGGASRFFYQAKAAKSERNAGLGQEILRCERCDSKTDKLGRWPNQDPSPPEPMAGTSPPRDTSEEPLTGDSGSPTTSSGSVTTDPSQMGTRSTTSTGTSRTTGSTTSSASPPPSTSGSTPGANSEVTSGGSPAGSAESSSPSTPTTGTSAPKAGPSTGAAAPATSRKSLMPRSCGVCGATGEEVVPVGVVVNDHPT